MHGSEVEGMISRYGLGDMFTSNMITHYVVPWCCLLADYTFQLKSYKSIQLVAINIHHTSPSYKETHLARMSAH